MPSNPRSYKVASTTVAVAISNYDANSPINNVAIINKSDGDVEVYFQDPNVNLICPNGFVFVLDGFTVKGQAYVRNISGTGGNVYLTFWAAEGH